MMTSQCKYLYDWGQGEVTDRGTDGDEGTQMKNGPGNFKRLRPSWQAARFLSYHGTQLNERFICFAQEIGWNTLRKKQS
jgi:hypothetical protein